MTSFHLNYSLKALSSKCHHNEVEGVNLQILQGHSSIESKEFLGKPLRTNSSFKKSRLWKFCLWKDPS